MPPLPKSQFEFLPRFIRLRDAPKYLGMDKNRFNHDVRPHVTVIPIGTQGIAFDRVDLDAWADHYKHCNGRPAAQSERSKPWETHQRQVSPNVAGSGTSTSSIEESAFCESTGTGNLTKAQEHLAKRMNDVREAQLYGVRESHTFRAAATRYLEDYAHKKSIRDDAVQLKMLVPVIGDLDLRHVHMGALQEFIAKRKAEGVKTKTLNAALAVVRRILNVAASEWFNDSGLTWLETAPKIKLFSVKDARAPYPLTQEEQAALFQELPDHLARMALFKVNTGCREQEVCGLRWDYEVKVPELNTSVFLIPKEHVKNGEERLVVLNRVAKSVVESLRGSHPTHVFVHTSRKQREPQPVKKMNNTAWKSARERAAEKWAKRHGELAPDGFRRVRVHDLKHTFGRRLRAAGVTFEDRQDLLGHRSGRITTHYSQAELGNLIAAADKVCATESRKPPATTWLRRRVSAGNT